MEKRKTGRRDSGVDAKISSSGKVFRAYVENMCERGIHGIAASKEPEISLVPHETIGLDFDSPCGKEISMQCLIQWVHINKTPIHGYTYRMGMQIIEHSPEYEGVLKNMGA
ncbi:MAG: hypothetical protein ISR96_07295 [Nitrospira sp.]|nr:hypothetical protein [Nitrospira sp.]